MQDIDLLRIEQLTGSNRLKDQISNPAKRLLTYVQYITKSVWYSNPDSRQFDFTGDRAISTQREVNLHAESC